MSEERKPAYRSFHFFDRIGKASTVFVSDEGLIMFDFINSHEKIGMTVKEFDSLIEYVYSELKKRNLIQKEA